MAKLTQPASVVELMSLDRVFTPGCPAAVLEDDIRAAWAMGKVRMTKPRSLYDCPVMLVARQGSVGCAQMEERVIGGGRRICGGPGLNVTRPSVGDA